MSNVIVNIESLEYIHNNINSRHIFLDNKDQLKVVNFDYVYKIDDDLKIDYELYIRFYKRKTTNNDMYKLQI